MSWWPCHAKAPSYLECLRKALRTVFQNMYGGSEAERARLETGSNLKNDVYSLGHLWWCLLLVPADCTVLLPHHRVLQLGDRHHGLYP